MFMGTPHQDSSGMALSKLIVNIASVFMAGDGRLLQHLERDSELLQQQLDSIGRSCAAAAKTTRFSLEIRRVPGAADAEPIAIHARHTKGAARLHNLTLQFGRPIGGGSRTGDNDRTPQSYPHSKTAKFGSKLDNGYKTVSDHTRLITANAGDAVSPRWDTEGRVNAARSNAPIESFNIRFGVRGALGVEHFFSRSEELDRIHKELRNNGSHETVVVHGLGSMGTTQLALPYAKRHRDE
ncbi:hypothetical protein K469DRAFT_755150 [Zopfia rhizophila CBS 207.26]|uniref:Uncharacterized protein n=1 Tax=Zopfia rhizophila CBS 207.26 TaxID=1314779 RepID=A0A6A6DGH5_9PEZI|nr:hypothetical protein K469DRAFT_755150 [Zopfia rhizophila CBS 207.26]